MKTVQRARLLVSASLLTGFMTGVSPAHAEAQPALDEIVVTAQKRSESIQDVPASITALTSTQLATAGITNTMQLAQSTPGLTFGSTGPWTNFYMRGIGNSFATPAAQPPVALYVDGVYQADSAAMALGLDDVERVEILKGPQGTLYGRNAVGGAINVITRAPTQELDLRIKGSYGNFDSRTISGYLSGGTDLVQANIAATRRLRHGYYINIAPGGKDLDNLDDLTLRSKIRVTPTDRVSLTLAADYSLRKGRGPGTANLPYAPGAGVIPTGALFGGILATRPWETSNTADLSGRAEDKGLSLTGRFAFDGFDIVSITAARKFTNKHGVDFDATNATVTEWRASDFHKQASQELQILSNGEGPLNWIAGLYYLNDKAGFAPLHFNSFADFGGVFIDINSKVKSESWAAYAEGTYNLNDALSLIVGGRYSKDKSTHYDSRQTVTDAATDTLLVAFDSGGNNHSWNAFTPRVSLKYERPEGLYYVTASKGYSAGLYNVTNVAPVAALDDPIKPQKINAIEAGAKWELLDRRLQINLAGFIYELKNMQTYQIAGNGLTAFENSQGKIRGIDLDAVWKLSSLLTLRGAFEVLNAHYGSYKNASVWVLNPDQGNLLVPPCGGQPGATPFDSECQGVADLSGKRMMRSPKFTSTLGADLSLPVLPDNLGKLVLTGNWYHSDSYLVSVNGSMVSPKYDSFNASLTFTSADDRWTASVWGSNLSNAKYYTTGGEGNYGQAFALAEPRFYGVTVGLRFGQ